MDIRMTEVTTIDEGMVGFGQGPTRVDELG